MMVFQFVAFLIYVIYLLILEFLNKRSKVCRVFLHSLWFVMNILKLEV